MKKIPTRLTSGYGVYNVFLPLFQYFADFANTTFSDWLLSKTRQDLIEFRFTFQCTQPQQTSASQEDSKSKGNEDDKTKHTSTTFHLTFLQNIRTQKTCLFKVNKYSKQFIQVSKLVFYFGFTYVNRYFIGVGVL